MVNDLDVLTFREATLEALEDGRRIEMDELEVERHDLHLIEVRGRRGDPVRRLRTVADRVVLEVGPFTVTGYIHRPPNTQPLAALARRSRFLPVTGVAFQVGRDGPERREEVILVNRDRITKSHALPDAPVTIEVWDIPPSG